jgi:tripartite-type tricarboxylate transporter receptor subunit TctC
VIARYLGAKLTDRLGTPVIIDNKAGAGGIVAADAVAKATDGATVLLATGGAVTIAPHLQAKLPYDPVHELVPVALVADTPMTLSVRTESPYKTIADVLRDAKARPGQVTYASTGNGTVSHLTGALLAQASGVNLLHVPYRGAAPALTDLLGGQVATIVTSVASIEPMVASGKARVLGTFSRAALPSMGTAPTVGEATGLAGMEVPVWVGVMAPGAHAGRRASTSSPPRWSRCATCRRRSSALPSWARSTPAAMRRRSARSWRKTASAGPR